MKLIFLDIDGVLNSARTAIAFGKFPLDLTPEDFKLFDHVALGLMQRLAKEGVKFVLSSTWRRHHNFDDVGKFLDLPIIAATPVFNFSPRGREIFVWINEEIKNGREITNYCIVDDDSDMLASQKPHFVQTLFEEGFSYQNYIMVREILNIS